MRWKLLGVFVATLASLALVLSGADARATLDAISAFELGRVPLVAALYGLVLLARTERFRRLLPTPVAYGRLLAVMGASLLAINVMPLRTGELVRPYLLSQRGVPLAESVAAVVVERALDMLALLALVALATNLVDAPRVVVLGIDVVALGQRAIALGVVALFVGLAVLRAATLRRPHADAPPEVGATPLGRLARLVDGAFRGIAARTPADRAAISLATLASWGAAIAACGVAMGGFGELDASASAVLFDWAATVSAVVVVPTPGFLGGFEAGAVGGLVALGQDTDAARAYALTLHAIQFGFTFASGVIGFVALGTSPGGALAASRRSG